MKTLLESSLSRIWQHITDPTKTFGVVSAYRQDLYSEEQNLQRHKELGKIIRSWGYGFIEQNSGYSYKDEDTGLTGVKEEKSYFVPNITFDDVLDLGVEFEQESVLYKDDTGFGLYISKTGKLDMEFKDEGSIMSFQKKDIEIAYSELIRANQSQKVKFSYIVEKFIPNRNDSFKSMRSKEIPKEGWISLLE